MHLDRRYLVWALGYAAVGMTLGIYMAASHNHAELVAHAHILLIGFLLSFIYGIIHRLWLEKPGRIVANLQFGVHQLAAIGISVGLFLLYGGIVPESQLEVVLGVSSVSALLGMLLMLYMVLRFSAARANA